jgi:hypothetical protein
MVISIIPVIPSEDVFFGALILRLRIHLIKGLKVTSFIAFR